MDITVRQASVSEIDKLLEWRMEVLRNVFGISETNNDPSLYAANREYYLESIPSGGHIAVFAEIDNTTIGCGGLCLYKEMPSPDNPTGQCAYLMNVYTRKEYRNRGVGKTVVEWLVNYAKKQGITKIYLETSDCGRPLYASLGFKDMRDYMKM